MTVHELLAILLPVLSALVAAHREGVFHRDLKPANIFLSKDSIGRVHPKVVDFGISKILDDENGFDLTKSATVLGTPYYMAPEQVHSIKRTDARSDQYALGVIAYECLTGRRPFSGESLYELMTAITTTDAVPPDRIVASIPSGVRDAIVRAMRREPDARFASVRELGRALYPYADELARSLWASEFGDRQATPSPSPPAKERAHSSDASTQAAEPASTLATFGAEVRAAAPAAAGAKGSNRRTLWLVGAAAACVIGLTASAMALRHPSQSPVAESSTSAQRLATSEVAPLPSASVAVAASTDAASTDSPAASAAASVAATDAVPGSSARPSEAKTPGHSRKDSAAKTSTDTPARPGDGAVRGANSAWIIR